MRAPTNLTNINNKNLNLTILGEVNLVIQVFFQTNPKKPPLHQLIMEERRFFKLQSTKCTEL